MKVKIISRSRYDYLESAVNEWLNENKHLKIIDIKYTAGVEYVSGSEYSAMIIYQRR